MTRPGHVGRQGVQVDAWQKRLAGGQCAAGIIVRAPVIAPVYGKSPKVQGSTNCVPLELLTVPADYLICGLADLSAQVRKPIKNSAVMLRPEDKDSQCVVSR